MSDEMPKPANLRKMRESLGLSQTELADALGFGVNGPRTIRAWESGERDGKPFHPTPTALAAFKYLICLYEVYEDPLLDDVSRGKIYITLPEVLR